MKALEDSAKITRTPQQRLMLFINNSFKICVFNFLTMDRLYMSLLLIFSSAGWASSISGQKLSSVCLCLR